MSERLELRCPDHGLQRVYADAGNLPPGEARCSEVVREQRGRQLWITACGARLEHVLNDPAPIGALTPGGTP